MTTQIIVQNLKCGGCANTIKKNLEKLEGVSKVEVEIEKGEVSFEAESEQEMTKVKESLKSMGYPAIDDPNSISAKAKSFVSCGMGRIMNN
ncbi:heavy-metal-associated domain-containing protein [Flagellimonas nanhaiensis]|uniref:Heavy-metal-associated domain-containing protein n=1 Tax=Flagellimonas nanhaiensis TaxID=2292706 RepID=A0A371JN46_9FLAO|nr:heavy metal-associated domain-containing protein [Allomuricauda nanhaiensis]RDY58665.1 heavy-metal-associated domain-containing protein [Allomuricauda nanhaiensis]